MFDLTSVVTARVVAYDLVSVGDMATVHGPRHLTAVNYGSRRMVLKAVKVGAACLCGPPTVPWNLAVRLLLLAMWSPLSAVSSDMVVDSRVCGVPAQVVGPERLESVAGSCRSSQLPNSCCLVCHGILDAAHPPKL